MALNDEEVGRRIREARVAHGWTNEELARRMAVNWRTVQRWQAGRLPRLGTLGRLADVLGVPRAFLLESEGSAETIHDLRNRLDELAERIQALADALEALRRRDDR